MLPAYRTQAFMRDAISNVREALRRFVTEAGADWNYGSRLFGDVRIAGLVDVDAEGPVAMEVLTRRRMGSRF